MGRSEAKVATEEVKQAIVSQLLQLLLFSLAGKLKSSKTKTKMVSVKSVELTCNFVAFEMLILKMGTRSATTQSQLLSSKQV